MIDCDYTINGYRWIKQNFYKPKDNSFLFELCRHGSKGKKWVEEYFQRLFELRHHGIKGQKWGVRNGPPYPLKSATLKNAAGKDIISVEHIDLKGPPGGITQVTRKNGGIDRNYYDETGRQITQISNHNHGQPGKHPYGKHGEHAHDYIYDDAGKLQARPARNLTEKERKENGDFL